MAMEIFLAYAREDKTLLEKLDKHLNLLEREGVIKCWDDRDINAGDDPDVEIMKHLDRADLLLLLISPDFMNSDFWYGTVMHRAMERHERGKARVIPIILRQVDWEEAPFGKLKALPKDAKPVRSWPDQDEAFLDVVKEIRTIVVKKQSETPPRVPGTSLPQRNVIGLLPLIDPKTIPQRESTVDGVYKQLTQQDVNVLVLTGLDGIGKSTLAALVYEYTRKQSLAGKGPFSAVPFWIEINPTITMIDLSAMLFKVMGRYLPEDFVNFQPGHQAVTLFQALNKTNKPFLIVLDQFNHLLDGRTRHVFADRPGVGKWLDALNRRPCRCRVLITSQHFPSGFTPTYVQEYAVEGLGIADGIDLLRKQGVEAPEKDLRAAVETCGGVALALQLLVRDLRNRKLSLQAFLKDPKYTQFWKGNVAGNLVDSIYIDHLDDLQRRLLIAFSVYREAVALEAAQAILDNSFHPSNSQIVTALDTLLAQNLLQALGEGFYRVRTLIVDYLQVHLVEGDEHFNLQTAHYRAAKYYLQRAALYDPSEEKPEDIDDVHHLIEAVWHLCQAQQWAEAYARMFLEGLYTNLKLWGENETLLELILLFLPIGNWHPNGSQEANIYNSLGMVYNLLGTKKEALKYYRMALDIVEGNNLQEEGKTLRHIGRVYNALGKKKEALGYFTRALDILEDGNEPLEVGITYERLGRVYNVLGQKEKAVDAYQKALKIYRVEKNAIGEGTTLSYLGRVYSTLGKEEQGLTLCRQGLDILHREGDRRGEGRAYDNLGRIYHVRGQLNKAQEAYEKALNMANQVGDLGGQGIVLQGLGNVYIALEQKGLAQKTYEQSLDVLRKVGDKWREGMVLSSLATICADLGQKEMALKYYKEAIGVRRGVEDYEGESMILCGLGTFYLTQQDYEAALACLLCANTIVEKGHYPGQDVTQEAMEELRIKIGEEQFIALLERVETQAPQLVDWALLKES